MSSTKGITDEMVRLVGKGVGVRSGELVVVKFSSISGRVGNGLSFRWGFFAGLRRRGYSCSLSVSVVGQPLFLSCRARKGYFVVVLVLCTWISGEVKLSV